MGKFLFGAGETDPAAEIAAVTAGIVKARGEASKFRAGGQLDLAAKADLKGAGLEKQLAGLQKSAQVRVDIVAKTKGLDDARAQLAAAQKAGNIGVAVKAHLDVAALEKELAALKARLGGGTGLLGGAFAAVRAKLGAGLGGPGLLADALLGVKGVDAATGQATARVGGLVGVLRGARGLAGALGAGLGPGLKGAAGGLGKTAAVLGGAGAALGGPLLALFKGGIDKAADLHRLSQEMGVSVEILNKMQYAADRAGVSLDEVMQDRTGRYTQFIAEAPPIDPANAKAAADVQNQLADAVRSMQDALLPLVQTIVPFVKQVATWAKENAGLLAVLVPVAAGLTLLGTGFAVASVAAYGVGSAFAFVGGVALTALGLVKGAVLGLVGAALSPLGLVVLAVGGVAAAYLTLTDSGRKTATGLKAGFLSVADAVRGDLVRAFGTARSAFGGIANAMKKGDLEGAAEIATTSIELLWAGTVLRMEKGWAALKGNVLGVWEDLTGGLAAPLSAMWEDFKDFHAGIWNAFKDAADKIERIWDRLWEQVREPVLKVLDWLKPLGVVLAAPFLLAAGLAREAWDGATGNITENIVTFGSWVERIFAQVGARVENAFKDVTQKVIAMMLTAGARIDAVLKAAGGAGLGDTLKGLEAVNDALKGRRDPDAEAGAIKKRRDELILKLQGEREAAKKARDEASGADIKGADDKVAELEKKLAGLNADAAKPKAPGPELPKLPDLKAGLIGTLSVKGGFGSQALGQQFGISDQVLKQTEIMRQLRDGEGKLPAAIGIAVGASIAAAFNVR